MYLMLRNTKQPLGPAVYTCVRRDAPDCSMLAPSLRVDFNSSPGIVEQAYCKQIYNYRSVAQSGSAPGLGPGGQRFESSHSDQVCSHGGIGRHSRLKISCRTRRPGSSPGASTIIQKDNCSPVAQW